MIANQTSMNLTKQVLFTREDIQNYTKRALRKSRDATSYSHHTPEIFCISNLLSCQLEKGISKLRDSSQFVALNDSDVHEKRDECKR
uniref:Uncharacterized protein n=1 Tax=Trichogramma kaykai TaxID=54128 RepID=A0ABD2VZA8_9HYME